MTERINRPTRESLPTKEILITKFSVVTISGRSGTGKTVTAEGLAELYSIPEERNKKTGQLMREITESGQESQGFIDRAEYVDKKLDRMQRELIRNSTPENPLLLEGRLAGVIANEERRKNPELIIASLLFVAPSAIRMERILKRHLEDNPELQRLKIELDNALKSDATPELVASILHDIKSREINLKTVKDQEKEREQKDLARWRKHHPQLEGIDPFDPSYVVLESKSKITGRTRERGEREFYDFIIHTGDLSVEATVRQINSLLIRKKLVEKIKRQNFPQSGDIFPN